MTDLSKGFLSNHRTPKEMIILDYAELAKQREACKTLGLTVGLTQGSFDLKHLGHDRYIMQASFQCDVLIVGVDSDDKIKKSKGPNRPVVGQEERLEQICYIRGVKIVTLKAPHHKHLELLKAVQPDVLIISTSTKEGKEVPEYTDAEMKEREPFCGKIIILQPQAPTSTTARIRSLMIDFASLLEQQLVLQIPEVVRRVVETFASEQKPKKKGT